MPLFAVIGLDSPAPVSDAVRTQYGANAYTYGSNVWLIQDNGSSKDVCDKLGIPDGRLGASAIVLRFEGYSGWGPNATWQWLASHPGAVSNG